MRDLPHVINWRRLSDQITTSGQPTEAELAEIKALGVTQIVNLGPHTNRGALDDEPASVAALGLEYIYIPVDFAAPTQADFDAFNAALAAHKGRQIHVHCIYNARVSAFFYRAAAPADRDALFQNMDGIWRPGGVWASFIDKPEDVDKPNRYAGDDY
jgi:protein tyrosine phosphatase (PTP) superfamily phosphohydrolase (DUF442 family)